MRSIADLLIAAALLSVVPAPAHAANYFFRAKPVVAAVEAPDSTPDAFSFAAVTEAYPATLVTSNRVALAGHTGVTASISGEGSAQFRICSDAACSSATAWGTAPVEVPSAKGGPSYAEVRMTSGAIASAPRLAAFKAGTISAAWSVTAKASAVDTTTAGLPAGWELEYVPSTITVANEQWLASTTDKARLRDGDLTLTAWKYHAAYTDATVVGYGFAGSFQPSKCFLAWRNGTSNTYSIRIRFVSTEIAVLSVPGVNTYNGSCGGTGTVVNSTHATFFGMPGIDVLEYKVGK